MAESELREEKMICVSEKRIRELLGIHKIFHKNCEYLTTRQAKGLEKKHGGRVLVVIGKKIRSFEPEEFDDSFKKLEDEIGKDILASACVTYIPKPNEILIL